jgi:hypothetical protein
MTLTIKPTKTVHAPGGQRYTFDPNEMRELLRANYDADVAIVNESGEQIRMFNSKDYLAAMALLQL